MEQRLEAVALGSSFRLKSRRSGKSQVFRPASSVADRFIRGLPRAEGSSMSFVAWKILRRLPRPLKLVILLFVLAAAARA